MRFLFALAVLAAAPVWAQGTAVDLAASTVSAAAQAPRVATESEPLDPARAPVYYVVARDAALRGAPDARASVTAPVRVREGVRVLAPAEADGWRLVQVGETRGYLPVEAISNLWIRVDKSERTLYLYRGADLVRTFPADVSLSDEDKVRQSGLGEADHYRMPEGTFFVTRRNADSQYYKAFVLSYPGPVHAERGLRDGVISPAQYQAILNADREGREPPMGTRLGGMIEIHGSGSGRQRAWTRGCAALRNVHMDELWDLVPVGTPVVIQK